MKKNKVKILIVGSDLSVKGGITSVIERFLKNKWNHIEVELHPTYVEGSILKKIIFFFKSIIDYTFKVIKKDFDIAHIHMSYKGSFFRKWIVVKISKTFNRKIVLHLHGSEFEVFYNSSSKIVKNMIKSIFEDSDRVIVLGEKWEHIIRSISKNAKIEIFNNAVEIPKEKVTWCNNEINILFLGVLIKRKGVYDLIESIRILKNNGTIDNKKLNFIIGGAGSEEKQINELINKYKLHECVEMKGWVSGQLKKELIKKAQLFILPSYNEGLPMAILETMSYGMPVISTDVGSISEVVKNNYTGFLIKPGEKENMASLITEIIGDQFEWEKMSQNCKNEIFTKFNENVYFKDIENLYDSIIYNY